MVLLGRPTVFLSGSEKYKHSLLIPIRSALEAHGIFGVIVSEEPRLPRTADNPDAKVDSYLDASDAFVAVCTPDDELSDGSAQPRPKIIDEHRRASGRPGLKDKIQVLKEASVRLPSNINPVREPLDLRDPTTVAEKIIRQLATWGVIGPTRPVPPSTQRADPSAGGDSGSTRDPSPRLRGLMDGLQLGDHDKAAHNIFRAFLEQDRSERLELIGEILDFLDGPERADNPDTIIVGSLLEAAHRIDPAMLSFSAIEDLAASQDFSVRSTAAAILWDRAEASPGDVPLALLGRLARPADEDWYVQAPAMAAAKLLLLRRRPARVLFDALAADRDPENRFAAATALLEIAGVDRFAVPRDLAEILAGDSEDLIAEVGRELLSSLPGEEETDPWSPFGL